MDIRGLTANEVKERISAGKVNSFESPVSRSYLDIFIKNVFTTFNLILLILGIALLHFDEDPISALSATGVIALNVLIATVQEMRAKRRLDKIALLLRPIVRVLRDGKTIEVDPSKVVMDDVIFMSSGDQAQVDGELIEGRFLEMDESLLTGESSSRRKKIGDVIHSGSFCITGEGYYRTTALGKDTVASEMLLSAKKYKKKNTPLQRETSTVTKMLMVIAFAFLLIIVIINAFTGGDVLFLKKAVIVLDIVPIALFLLITITYMISTVRMADSGVLLQNSNSVESMSHVDTVCMDKTGTITTNNLLFESMEMFVDEKSATAALQKFISATGSKNRTIKALEEVFDNIHVQLLEEIPFSSDRKYSAVRIASDAGSETYFMGAWSSLKNFVTDGDVTKNISNMSQKGLRTIVLCNGGNAPLYNDDEPSVPKLELIALIFMKDEVRKDCKEIIDEFQKNKMDIRVISGDDPETIDSIFSLAGIAGERNIISGEELESVPQDKLNETILKTNIFGRMKPDQKELVIESLKNSGRYVAMVGDGVNDVRSLKAANVGVALQSGSGAARSVADMVLVNDRFSALPKAITEGKRTVTGMRDILRLYLTRNFVLAILVALLLVMLGRMPMLPVHNTLYALTSVSLAAFLMALWAKPSDNKTMILPGVLRFSIPMAIMIAAFGLLIYVVFLHGTGSGLFDLGENFYHQIFESYGDAIRWTDWDSFWEKCMSLPGESFEDVTARNAMLMFLMLAGISQLFFIYPLSKFYSVNNEVSKDLKPTILALLLFGLVALVYSIPLLAVEIASLAIFPLEYYLLIIGFVVLWFFVTVLVLKSPLANKMSQETEKAYRKSLDAEMKKEDQGK